jgi:hypothetical protein
MGGAKKEKKKILQMKRKSEKKCSINQRHLFGSNEIIAYICCYKYVKQIKK